MTVCHEETTTTPRETFETAEVALLPTGASPEKGRRLFEHATDGLRAPVGRLADRAFEALSPEPHR